MEPNFGDEVFVKPRLGLAVQVSGIFSRFLPKEGQIVIWNDWYHRRWLDGSIEIVLQSKLTDED